MAREGGRGEANSPLLPHNPIRDDTERHDPGETHNPLVGGSSPPRPTPERPRALIAYFDSPAASRAFYVTSVKSRMITKTLCVEWMMIPIQALW